MSFIAKAQRISKVTNENIIANTTLYFLRVNLCVLAEKKYKNEKIINTKIS